MSWCIAWIMAVEAHDRARVAVQAATVPSEAPPPPSEGGMSAASIPWEASSWIASCGNRASWSTESDAGPATSSPMRVARRASSSFDARTARSVTEPPRRR